MVEKPGPQVPGEIAEDQPALFDAGKGWQREWVGMPEFEQKKQREFAKLTVRFRSKEDLDKFAALIGQRLNANSQCTWFPELPPNGSDPMVYVDES